VDTLIFITVSFYGVRPIFDLMMGQMVAKIVLSAVMVPLVIALVVRVGRRLDQEVPA
jgi:queuosine precursor transporter